MKQINFQLILFISPAVLLIFTACNSNKTALHVKEGYLAGANGAKLYYRVMGTGQDTVVVVHGGPGAGMNTVVPSFKSLAKKYVLIFYDQRGGGRSTLPADTTKLKPQYFVEDLEAVRTHFELGKMNVITHSFGSILVAEYAKKYHEHLKRIAFHGAVGPRRSDMAEMFRKRAATGGASPDTALSNRVSELLQSLLNGTAANPVKICQEYEEVNRTLAKARGEQANYKGTQCKATREAVSYYFQYTAQLAPRYFGKWDYTTGLEEVSAPVLVIYGTQDSLAIPTQRQWIEAVSNGRLLLVPKTGKAAASDNPEFVFPAIDVFFKGNWPEKASK